MSIENETADQVVKMVLQGSEVVLRLSGEATLRIATMIYNAVKNDMTKKGKSTLWEFMKSGKAQKLFTIPDSHLKAFTTASKKFGFPFVILKDKSDKNGFTDIIVYATDASKVNRVLENLKLTVKHVETIKPEIITEKGDLVKPLGMQLNVPLELIDNIPETPKNDRKLMSELLKYAAKIKREGPQVIEPVGLLCKPNGRYEVIDGQGSKRLMVLRLADYREAVADISVPKKEGVEAKVENAEDRPSQERSETPKSQETSTPEKTNPTKEDGQSVNPTMARTSRDPASGPNSAKKSKNKGSKTKSDDPENRPSVRKKLEKAKVISAERQAARMLERPAPTPKPR